MSRKVSIFITCSADLLYPNVPIAAVSVLEALGVEVDFNSDQTCCGQPFLNSGDIAGARAQALHFARTFNKAQAVVSCSASCVDTVRNRYPALFPEESAEAGLIRQIVPRVFEFTEYVNGVLGLKDIPALAEQAKTTYHSSCRTLRGIGLKGVVEEYLSQMIGQSFVPLPEAETCCGFGGSFSVKLPEISAAMMRAKLAAIRSTGARRVVTLDLGCATHLSCGAEAGGQDGLEFIHLAEMLADALKGRATR